MMNEIYNPNPTIFAPVAPTGKRAEYTGQSLWIDEDVYSNEEDDGFEAIDRDEIYELIRHIYDPEHPNTLEQLRVVSAPQITVDRNRIDLEFTPTIPHCGMSTLIGLTIRVRLLRSLPSRFKVDIHVKPGSHVSEHSVNRQLNDKERVAAALENPSIVESVEMCLRSANQRGLFTAA